ncbi:AAA family ATPase [Bacillota bacterium Lsc_1132]
MIEAIKLKGFQSHTASFFHLGSGLNVITGPSDSGKTAIIRAVKWVAFNEPQGEAFLNKTVGEAEVEITLTNGVTITKRRKSKKTTYQLSTIPEPFEKSEVPLEVQQALGIVKQTFGDFVTALNFAFQLEAPFLISETASAGAKILGKLAGTEAVDLAIKGVSKDTYAARQERTQAEKDREKIEAQLSEFMNLDNLKEQLEACEYLAQQIEGDAAKVDKLKQSKIAYGTLSDSVERLAEKLDRLAIVGDLDEELKNVEAAQQRYDLLLRLYSQLNRTTAALQAANERLALCESIDLAEVMLAEIDLSSQRAAALSNLSTKYRRYSQENEKAEQIIEKMAGLEEADSLLEGIRKANERQDLLKGIGLNHDYLVDVIERRAEEVTKFEGLAEADSNIQQLETYQAQIMALRSLRAKHNLDRADLDRHINWIAKTESDLAAAQQELAAAWEAAGDICPLCEQPLDGGHNHA